ncbi:unnamed protein product [Acanthosepion pharaonis]|uniref:Uncharacterized protein n=1 Tax=Acanthosepion pharaonis TaxID=158019 RepID=A0A812BTS8_ACAPH|nr:unnamed protein product [Sepia pharaonis]
MVPSTHSEKKENVERVLQFMSTNHIRMHPMKASDIVEGNLKCIMRLVLALAAHFKPNSVKHQSVAGVISPNRGRSLASIAQSAAVTLATARRFVSRANKHGTSYRDYGPGSHLTTDLASMQARMMRLKSHPANKRPLSTGDTGDFDMDGMPRSRSAGFIHDSEDSVEYGQDCSVVLDQQQYNDLMKEYDDLVDTMKQTKKDILKLQDLLLNGETQDGETPQISSDTEFEGYSVTDQLVLLRSRLQQSTEVCTELQEELSKTKLECRELYGIKAGLQQRLSEQESALANSKAESCRAGLDLHSLQSEKAMMLKKLADKDKQLMELKKEVSKKDKEIEDLQFELNPELLQEKDPSGRNRWFQVRCLQRLQAIRRTETEKTGEEEEIDEIQVLQDSVQKLRRSFNDNDCAQLATLDKLEQNVVSLIEKMHYGNIDFLCTQSPSTHSRRRTASASTDPRSEAAAAAVIQSETKILYYIDNSETPYLITIPKRLGEITLLDFRKLCGRSEDCRYQFKALDPEFGTVKEELSNDTDLLPGWEGKIVAWVEERKS